MTLEARPHAVLDLGVRGRALFVFAFLGVELLGIVWGQRAPDHTLAFQMFNESSRFKFELFREVERKGKRVLLPIPDGTWQESDASGTLRDYAWQARVRYTPLKQLGRQQDAAYGLSAQLFRLQAALDDVVRHIPDDTRTRALVAVVEATHNGRPQAIQLRAERP